MLDAEQIENWESAVGPELAKIAANGFRVNDARTWPVFPIVMPLTSDGRGPASGGHINKLTWEVWDHMSNSYGSYDNLPDAINKAVAMNLNILVRNA